MISLIQGYPWLSYCYRLHLLTDYLDVSVRNSSSFRSILDRICRSSSVILAIRSFGMSRPVDASRCPQSGISPSSPATFCWENPPGKCSTPSSTSMNDPETLSLLESQSVTLSSAVAQNDYDNFIREYPEYLLTWPLGDLRKTNFSRLDRNGETYVDYMGGSLYPENLIRLHTEFLSNNVLGNTHSASSSSLLSSTAVKEARHAVLDFFQAPPGYAVVFTSNTSSALKLIGESYPFNQDSTYILSEDSHNSVHGIRQFAVDARSSVLYLRATTRGGFDEEETKETLLLHSPPSDVSSLLVLTAQSNITNTKNALHIVKYAAALGYNTVLDIAALAPTSSFSLTEDPVDAVVLSFYKMFGFPTGIGALVAKTSFLEKLRRPWFAGGTVDIVQVPGGIVTRSSRIYEQFEDGTLDYVNIPAITHGLAILKKVHHLLPIRMTSLLMYLVDNISKIRHESSGTPVAKILSRIPSSRVRAVGEQSDTGAILALIFLFPCGETIPNRFIEKAASRRNISLRTGCMCNPGGAAALLGIQDDMANLYEGVTLKDFEDFVGKELGVVRISLGLASNFQDVWTVVQFVKDLTRENSLKAMWTEWTGGADRI